MRSNLFGALLTIFVLPQALPAQDVLSIGPRLGINIADVSNVEISSATTGVLFGLAAVRSISQTSGVAVDVLYSQEGYEIGTGAKFRNNYIQVPIMFQMFLGELGDKVRPKAYVGMAPGFLLKAKANDLDVTEDFKGVVVSAVGGLGVNYRLADRVWLNGDLRAMIGVTDIREENFQTNDKVAGRTIQISVGVLYGLSRF